MIHYASTDERPAELRGLNVQHGGELGIRVTINGTQAEEVSREYLEEKIDSYYKFNPSNQTFVDGTAVVTVSNCIKAGKILWYAVLSWGEEIQSSPNPDRHYFCIEEKL